MKFLFLFFLRRSLLKEILENKRCMAFPESFQMVISLLEFINVI